MHIGGGKPPLDGHTSQPPPSRRPVVHLHGLLLFPGVFASVVGASIGFLWAPEGKNGPGSKAQAPVADPAGDASGAAAAAVWFFWSEKFKALRAPPQNAGPPAVPAAEDLLGATLPQRGGPVGEMAM